MELKNAIKTIIADFHQRDLPKIIERNMSIPLDTGKVVTLIGPRRAGKTYLLFQAMRRIEDKTNILYINFEDERLSFRQDDLQLILDAYFELYPKKSERDLFIFFDEIQEVESWEKFVRRLYDTVTKKIFLTGSSAKMLSREIATSLRGRGISYEVYPLSFREYLRFGGVKEDMASTKGKAKAMHEFQEYLIKGGFPETACMEKTIYEKTLSSYFDVMLYRDIVERHSISNPQAVRDLLRHLVSQSSKEFSINKVYNDFVSRSMKISKDSLYRFVDYFEDAFIIVPIKNYSDSVRKQIARKSYAIDTGLISHASLSAGSDLGRLLENVVLLELKRRGKQVFFFKNGEECDFIIKENGKIKDAIQVCYELNESNRKREIKGLINAMRRFKLKGGTILTMEKEEKQGKITIKPATSWLVEG